MATHDEVERLPQAHQTRKNGGVRRESLRSGAKQERDLR